MLPWFRFFFRYLAFARSFGFLALVARQNSEITVSLVIWKIDRKPFQCCVLVHHVRILLEWCNRGHECPMAVRSITTGREAR